MKYSEMIKFLNDNGILVMPPVIASEVNSQLEVDIPENEFEEICSKVFDMYLSSANEPDIWYLVDEVLVKGGYKE